MVKGRKSVCSATWKAARPLSSRSWKNSARAEHKLVRLSHVTPPQAARLPPQLIGSGFGRRHFDRAIQHVGKFAPASRRFALFRLDRRCDDSVRRRRRQEESEGGTFRRRTLDMQHSAVSFDNGVADGKAEAASERLGRKIWIEDLRRDVVGDA